MIHGGRTPMFRLRPIGSMLVAALFVAVVGGLVSAYFFEEDSGMAHQRGLMVLVLTGIMTSSLIIIAFSRYGFKHLWHHRPRNKVRR